MYGFGELRKANLERVQLWHPGFPDKEIPAQEWNIAEWTNAMQGEAGEAGNIAKKIRRLDTNLTGRPSETNRNELVWKLGLELADNVIYTDLCAAKMHLDLWTLVVEKFNKTSEEYGFPQRLG